MALRKKKHPRDPGMSPFKAGVIALVVISVAVFWAFTKANPFASPYTLTAVFRSANNIKPNSPVRIAGVNVGKVTGVSALPGGEGAAKVTMQISKQGLPIHQDATLKIRPRIFLEGNEFVDLQPGSPASPVIKKGSHFAVPIQQTATPVQFDQVLTALQSDTRKNLQMFLKEYSQGLADGGAQGFNRAVRAMPSAYRYGSLANEGTLGTQPHDLSTVEQGQAKVFRALDVHEPELKDLITNFNRTMAALASESDSLRTSIRLLPRTLANANAAFASLNRAFPPLRRLIVDLHPALRTSVPALDASLPLAKQLRGLVSKPELRGLVRELRPAVPDLVRFNKANVPLGEQSRLLASCNNEVLIPWGNEKVPDAQFPAKANVNAEGARGLVGLSGESRSGDANGQWFRALVSTGNYTYQLNPGEFFQTGAPILGTNPPPAREMPPVRPDVPCETQPTPDLRTIPGPPPQSVEAKADPARYERAKEIAVKWLRGQVEREGYAGKLSVRSAPLTTGELQQLRRRP